MNRSIALLMVTGATVFGGALWLGRDAFFPKDDVEGTLMNGDGEETVEGNDSMPAEFSAVVQEMMKACREGDFNRESFEAAVSNMDAEISSVTDAAQTRSLEIERDQFITEMAVLVKKQLTTWANGPDASLALTWEANVRSVSSYLVDSSLLTRELRVAKDIRWAYVSGSRSACDARVDELLRDVYHENSVRDLRDRMEALTTQFAAKREMASHLQVQISRLDEFVAFAEVWNISIDLYIANEGKLPPHLRAASQYGLRIQKEKVLKYEWYKQAWLAEFGTI